MGLNTASIFRSRFLCNHVKHFLYYNKEDPLRYPEDQVYFHKNNQVICLLKCGDICTNGAKPMVDETAGALAKADSGSKPY